MLSNCNKCELPGIVARVNSARTAVDIANGNVRASSSPTEAKPYQDQAKAALGDLKEANEDFKRFVRDWSGFCAACQYGV